MAQAAWEKAPSEAAIEWEKSAKTDRLKKSTGRWKFLLGGGLILASVAFLVISSTLSGATFFITVDDVVNNPEYIGETVRISGAVIGETIQYDSETLTIDFTISHIPQEFDNLADALHESVTDPNMTRLSIHIENEVKPDLLQHEAQAILTGKMGTDGVFYADELLLKCPSRFQDADTNGIVGEEHPGMPVQQDAG